LRNRVARPLALGALSPIPDRDRWYHCLKVNPTDIKELLNQIEAQRSLMIEVSTGGRRIQQVNEEYREHRERIRQSLDQLGAEDPNPFVDLWRWYERWSSGDLPTYQSRRTFVGEMYDPLIQQLRGTRKTKELSTVEPTGWARVDRGIEKMRNQLETANSEEDHQAVGLRCREVLISLARLSHF
jgi:hypothetical protein